MGSFNSKGGKTNPSPNHGYATSQGRSVFGLELHYLIGIVFALILVLLMGEAWLADPSMIVALNTGIVTLIFPFFIIQPCLGFGIAASKTPSPWKARGGLSLLAHSFYGLGLFVTAVILK